MCPFQVQWYPRQDCKLSLNRRIYSECTRWWYWWIKTRLSLSNRPSDSRECSIGMATQAINHRHYPIVASESREKGDAADEGINAAVDARMSYPWSRHVASVNGLAPVEIVNGRFINSHRIANNLTYDFIEVIRCYKLEKRIRELEEPRNKIARHRWNLSFIHLTIIAVGDMSSRVKQQIRITIFFDDGTVVIYIWIGDVVTQIKPKRDQRRRLRREERRLVKIPRSKDVERERKEHGKEEEEEERESAEERRAPPFESPLRKR